MACVLFLISDKHQKKISASIAAVCKKFASNLLPGPRHAFLQRSIIKKETSDHNNKIKKMFRNHNYIFPNVKLTSNKNVDNFGYNLLARFFMTFHMA